MNDYYNSGAQSDEDIVDYDASYNSEMETFIDDITSENNSLFRNMDARSGLIDRDIFRTSFLIGNDRIEDSDVIRVRTWSSASSKFTDTSMGGNYGINARPQFTHYSDIPMKGAIASRNEVSITDTSGNYGMGRYYSEAIDDPSHTIYMRFGTPEYNGLFSFLMHAVSPGDVGLVKASRFSKAYADAYGVGKFVGSFYAFAAFPAFFLLASAATWVGSIFGRGMKRYYYFRSAMPLYWSAVNNLVNHVAINLNMLPKISVGEGKNLEISDQQDQLKALLSSVYGPTIGDNVFAENGYFDMYAIANRAQRLHNQRQEEELKTLEAGGSTLNKYYGSNGTAYRSPSVALPSGVAKLQVMLEKFFNKNIDYAVANSDDPNLITTSARNYVLTKRGEVVNPTDPNGLSIRTDVKLTDEKEPVSVPEPPKDKGNVVHTRPKDPIAEFMDYVNSERKDGAGFAVFKTDFPGSVSESFSNSFTDPPIKSAFNSTSRSMNAFRASISDFNTGFEFFDSAIQTVSGWAAGAVSGAASTMTYGGSDIVLNTVMSLFGDAYMDIPKIWEDSSGRFPSAEYKMTLISPYNNPLSLMQNIYMPLCMILAGALPRSTGKNSYGPPFLCQLFDRGRCTVQLGMIESVTITRGTSHLPFDLYGKALAVDVSFSVANLTGVMHYAMNSGSIFDSTASITEDSPMGEYLATISGMSISSMIYPVPKALRRLQLYAINAKQFTSPAFWASNLMDMPGFGLLKTMTPAQFSYLEGAPRQ